MFYAVFMIEKFLFQKSVIDERFNTTTVVQLDLPERSLNTCRAAAAMVATGGLYSPSAASVRPI